LRLQSSNDTFSLPNLTKVTSDQSGHRKPQIEPARVTLFHLILDPVLDSYYLMLAVLLQYPEAMEQLGQLRARGTAAIADRKINETERMKLSAHYDISSDRLQRVQKELERAINYNPALRNRIEQTVRSAHEKVQSFLTMVNEQLLRSQQVTVTPQEYFAVATAAIDSLFDLTKTLSGELDNLLKDRIQKLQRKRMSPSASSS